jgi:hypothetical protein
MQQLNLRLNRLGEKGGCYVFEGLKSNCAMRLLNISGNGLADESGQVCVCVCVCVSVCVHTSMR